jgi:hypothetical protein
MPQALNLVEPVAPAGGRDAGAEDKARLLLQMSFDFGTLAVYACAASCSLAPVLAAPSPSLLPSRHRPAPPRGSGRR